MIKFFQNGLIRQTGRAWIGIATFVALSATAGHSASSQSAADAKGKYVLARIGDTSLPAAVSDARTTWSILDGWLEVYSNSSWLLKVTLRNKEGRKKTSADFGNVTRIGDSLTFTSSIFGLHGAALTATTLELSYDIAGDSTSERLIFARPGVAPQSVVAAAGGSSSPAATTATTATPPPPAASPPATPAFAAPASSAPPKPTDQPLVVAPSALPNASTPNDAGPAPFDASGLYRLQLLNGKKLPTGDGHRFITAGTLQISDVNWELGVTSHGTISSGVHTSTDRGLLTQTGARVLFSSAEYGDFEGAASGKGTITMDFYFFGDEKPSRYVWVKDGVDDDPAATATAPTGSRSTSADPVTWSMISAGAFHACGLTTAGRAYCWGVRAHAPGSPGGERPALVPSDVSFAALTVGNPTACSPNREDESCVTNNFHHACALSADGAALCWGSNQFGQLGDGTTTESAIPKRVVGGLTFASISAGDAFTCGVTREQGLYCWGKNTAGQLGIGEVDGVPHAEPRPVARGVRNVAAGGEFACALRDDGSAFCWGHGGSDRLGTSNAVSYGPNASPLQLDTDVRFTSISVGRAHGCALTADGAAYCWGSNSYRESGPGSNASAAARVPSRVPGPSFSAISAGTANHTCAVSSTGAMYCWGNDNKGQLGTGMGDASVCGFEQWGCASLPIAVTGAHTFASVTAGVEFTCGVTTTGEAYCWGDNSRGQLGTGDRSAHRTPTPVARP